MPRIPCLDEQNADLGVGGLIEVTIELPDCVEGFRGLQANNLIGLATQLIAGAGRGDWHSNQDTPGDRTQGANRSRHGGSGGQTIIDEDGGTPLESSGRTAVAVSGFPAHDFKSFPRNNGVDGFLLNAESGDYVGLQHDHPSAGDRPHSQFFLARNAKFPHHKNIQRKMEPVGDLESHGNTAARQPQHDRVSGTQLIVKFVAKHLGQREASLPPILKDDDHLPPLPA